MELSLFCFIQKVIYQLNTEKRVKIVVIGNGGVGKTSLLFVLNGKPFPIKYIPTIYESSKIIYEDFFFYPWDTAGQDEYDRLRPLSYSAANIILLCFELDLKESFIDLSKKWIPEIKRYAKDAIIILIGTKSDLYIPENPNHVSENEAFMFTNQQKIYSFIQCSAKTGEGINKILPTIKQIVTSRKYKIDRFLKRSSFKKSMIIQLFILVLFVFIFYLFRKEK